DGKSMEAPMGSFSRIEKNKILKKGGAEAGTIAAELEGEKFGERVEGLGFSEMKVDNLMEEISNSTTTHERLYGTGGESGGVDVNALLRQHAEAGHEEEGGGHDDDTDHAALFALIELPNLPTAVLPHTALIEVRTALERDGHNCNGFNDLYLNVGPDYGQTQEAEEGGQKGEKGRSRSLFPPRHPERAERDTGPARGAQRLRFFSVPAAQKGAVSAAAPGALPPAAPGAQQERGAGAGRGRGA
ncbi:hypothetical protein T484DRAFT_1973210, partial [Baffinella frigidus]